jgi:hypothetical protein
MQMKMTLKSMISRAVAALAPPLVVLLSMSLAAIAQDAQTTDQPNRFRGNPEFGDPALLKAPDPADFLLPAPMGPPQNFAVTPRVSRAESPAQTAPAVQPSGHVVRRSGMTAQAERPRFNHKAHRAIGAGTQTASARPLRPNVGPNEASNAESALSFAPLERRRTRLSQPCFPLSAFEQNGLNGCGTGAPAYRGRFEELLGE